MLSCAFFISLRSKAHFIVPVEADRTRNALHRAAKATRLQGIGVTLILSRIKLVLSERRPDHDLLILQFRFAANPAIRVTIPAIQCRVGQGRNRLAARPIVRLGDQANRTRVRGLDPVLELRILVVPNLAGADWVDPETITTASLGESCMTSPGVSNGRDVS